MKTNFKYIFLSFFLMFFINCSEDKITLTGKGTITGTAVSAGDFEPLEKFLLIRFQVLYLQIQMEILKSLKCQLMITLYRLKKTGS